MNARRYFDTVRIVHYRLGTARALLESMEARERKRAEWGDTIGGDAVARKAEEVRRYELFMERAAELVDVLGGELPRREWAESIRLRCVHGLTWRETCEGIGCSSPTARKHIAAAAEWLDADGGERWRAIAPDVAGMTA